MYFLFSIATGISCCGGMCLFGLWRKKHIRHCKQYSRIWPDIIKPPLVSGPQFNCSHTA